VIKTALIGTVGSTLLAAAASAAPVVDVFGSIAPNATGSASWPAYQTNAMNAIEGGASTAGTVGFPTYYSQLPNNVNLLSGAWVVTDFNSWMGEAPPTSYGANYANEVGTRIHYGAHIDGNGTKFSLNQIGFKILYNDANFTDLSLFSVSAGTYVFDAGHVGLNYGDDNIKGTGDDIWITGGASSQLMDEYFTRGSGFGNTVSSSDPGATNQDKIDNWISTYYGYDYYTLSGTYYLDGNVVGAATQSFNPEPTSLGAVGLATMALCARRRRR
jgi:hypothetical protein